MIETKTITVTATGQQARIPFDPAKNNMIIANAGASDVFTVQGATTVGGTLINILDLASKSGPMQEFIWANFVELSISVATLVSGGFSFSVHSSPKH